MSTGFEDWSVHSFSSASEMEQQKADVTDSETELTFSEEVKSWAIVNQGPNPVYFSLATGVDTTLFPIYKKQVFGADVPTTKIYLICDTGETATVKAIGLR